MNSRRTVELVRWLLAFASLAAIVLVYKYWFHVNPTTVALTLLLLILVFAAQWGLRYAVVVSIVATACYNFFFLPPVNTFTINDPENWLALFVFLVTAILASRLAQSARNQADQARARQAELEILFRLSRELLQTENVNTLVHSIPSAVALVTQAKSATLYLLEGDRIYRSRTDQAAEIEAPHFRQLASGLSAVNVQPEESQVPLRTGVRPTGLLILRGTAVSDQTLEAIGGLISVSIERAQALEDVARGEASKESERLRTLMIDSITHELRTPLTSIKGAATALLSFSAPDTSSHELLTIIDEESDRLNRLVSEAVEMAQLDARQVQMHMVQLNVRSLVEDAREACTWVEENHPLTVDVAPQLQVHGDRDFLVKVLSNLLENAAKYSAPATPITISAEQRGTGVALSVADRGLGIEAAEQTLIFERFYRSRTHGDSTSGTGMGLPISRAIVEAHGGQMSVVSQPGKGSVFTFLLP